MTHPIYNYDAASKVYLGAGVADVDPLDPSNVLMPAHSTLVAVPNEIPLGQVAVFDEAAQVWNLASAALFQQQPDPVVPLTLDQLKAAAQAAIDAHFSKLYTDEAVTPAIANEYGSAYTKAKAWLDGGMAGDAPMRVTALAESMSTADAPVTDAQAAQYVVDKWAEAESVMDRRGAARLRSKAAIRAAQAEADVYAAEYLGRTQMEAIQFTL